MKTDVKKSSEIIKNVIVIYNDGYSTLFDAIYITCMEVVYGKFSDKNVFIKCGGIPIDNIDKIVVL
jgi:hypothetical protein